MESEGRFRAARKGRPRWRARVRVDPGPWGMVFPLVTMLLGSIVATLPSAGARPAPLASGVQLTVDGVSPAAVALGWSASAGLLLTFSSYTVYRSPTSAGGPWSSVATFSVATDTSFYESGLAVGQSDWWKVVLTGILNNTTTSNTVETTQPATALAAATLGGPASANLTWTNGATYGGALVFESYTVFASSNNGSFTAGSSITQVADHATTVAGLAPGAWYQFYVRTSDGCSGAANCGAYPGPSSTNSSVVGLETPRVLTATITASPARLSVGAAGIFACTSSGGTAPVKVTWRFGDGTSSPSGAAQHAYRSPAVYPATCTARDAYGLRSEATVNVTVVGNSSGSGGGNGTGAGNGTGGAGNSSGNGSGGGGGSGSGPGSRGSGPIAGSPASSASPLTAGTTAFLVLAFVALIVVLAILIGLRRSRAGRPPAGVPNRGPRTAGGPPPIPPTGALNPGAVTPPPATSSSPVAPRTFRGVAIHRPNASAVAPAPRRRTSDDLDEMLDELEGVSRS